ncbi:hypothetical protein GW756_04920 [bacterium]|nr:hypothetical protein [bacterium]NCQ55720.1 hypothetical protein [Candidatus Parcubacteria bacterium]NCS67669.1 hypothetical protein [Candidatus Peregrinibacteria bacterium]NCS96683.1 hypothetical protein [bacterium]
MKCREKSVEVVYAFRGVHTQERGSRFEGHFLNPTRERLAQLFPDDFRLYGAWDAAFILDALNNRPKAKNTLLVVEAPLTHFALHDTVSLVSSVKDRCESVIPFVFLSDLAHSRPVSESSVPEGFLSLKRRLETAQVAFAQFEAEGIEAALPAWLDFLDQELVRVSKPFALKVAE